MTRALSSPLLVPGRTCWRLEHAARASVLIDAERYYATLRSSLIRATRAVTILAWDVDSRTELVRRAERPDDGWPTALGELLHELVERRDGLEVRILEWDWAMIYAMEREWQPLFDRPAWRRHSRLHFHLDDRHPVGASHHQKVIVIDDAVAFAGGIDVSKWRWDRPAHVADEPDRVDPDGNPYPPYHDVQMVVDGQAAAALGELARERWRRATGERLDAPARAADDDPWPSDVEPELRDVEVGIARTEAPFDDVDEVREIERLWLEAIGAARRTVYVENQYLTSATVCDALCERLRETDGPEVVVVLPNRRTGWLERYTMGLLRSRCLRALRDADRHGRFGVYYPHVPGLDEQVMNIHAKVLVVDDRLLRVGSANVCNRSMGLDSECDLAIEAGEDDASTRERIAGSLHRLVAHQLGVEPSAVAEGLARGRGLLAAIEALRDDDRRCLRPLDGLLDERLERALPESTVIDPEAPIEPGRLVDELVGTGDAPADRGRRVAAIGLVALLVALAAAWRWTPLGEWLEPERLADWLRERPDDGTTMALVVASFVVGSLVAIPVSFLVVVSALVFDAPRAFGCAWVGATLGALATYWIGRALGRGTVRRLAGGRLNRLSRSMARRGVLTVAVLRIVPVAPFTVVNLAMGASHVRPWQFAVGTMIGLVPGILAISVFVERLLVALRQPDATSVAIAGVVGVLLFGALAFLRRRLGGSER